MNDPDRLDEAALRRLDDIQLESLRYRLLSEGDVRYEHVVEHLLVRGIGAIERIAAELCDVRGIGAEQREKAVIDASLRLQLRLAREERLPSLETLASQFATQCIDALGPAPDQPPRLASRPPQLRSIETQLGEALHDGRLRRKGGKDS